MGYGGVAVLQVQGGGLWDVEKVRVILRAAPTAVSRCVALSMLLRSVSATC